MRHKHVNRMSICNFRSQITRHLASAGPLETDNGRGTLGPQMRESSDVMNAMTGVILFEWSNRGVLPGQFGYSGLTMRSGGIMLVLPDTSRDFANVSFPP